MVGKEANVLGLTARQVGHSQQETPSFTEIDAAPRNLKEATTVISTIGMAKQEMVKNYPAYDTNKNTRLTIEERQMSFGHPDAQIFPVAFGKVRKNGGVIIPTGDPKQENGGRATNHDQFMTRNITHMKAGGSDTHSGLGTINEVLSAMEPIIYQEMDEGSLEELSVEAEKRLLSKITIAINSRQKMETLLEQQCTSKDLTERPCKQCKSCVRMQAQCPELTILTTAAATDEEGLKQTETLNETIQRERRRAKEKIQTAVKRYNQQEQKSDGSKNWPTPGSQTLPPESKFELFIRMHMAAITLKEADSTASDVTYTELEAANCAPRYLPDLVMMASTERRMGKAQSHAFFTLSLIHI